MRLNKSISLHNLSQVLQADLQKCTDPAIVIDSLTTIENSKSGDVTFLVNNLYVQYLADCQASVIIVEERLVDKVNIPCLVTKNPRLALARVLDLCAPDKKPVYSIHKSVVIGQNSNIDQDVFIGPNCVLGDNVTIKSGTVISNGVSVGDGCLLGHNVKLFANVVLYNNVQIGDNTTIHAGSVIGSDGFGYAEDNAGWVKMQHLGGVRIGQNVEIGSNVTIDRGCLEDTVVADGVIIDNLVQLGHNVHIGKNTAIAGCTGIAGSTKIGAHCLIGGGVGIAGHLQIADKVWITGTSAVNKSLTAPGVYSSGFPARENRVWLKNVARFQELDTIARKVYAMEQKFFDIERKESC